MTFKEKLEWVLNSYELGLISKQNAKDEIGIAYDLFREEHKEEEYENGEQTMPHVSGKYFRCECGCNVMTKSNFEPLKYRCNGCHTEYQGVAYK